MAKPELTATDVEEISEWFKFFDRNDDKKLDKDELSKVFTALGWNMTEEEKDKVFKNTDKDGSGFIEYDEYIILLKSLQKGVSMERMEILDKFRMIDTDHSGHITEEEMKTFINKKELKFSDKDKAALTALMKEADTNGDGSVDIAEFVDLMLKKPDIEGLKLLK